VGKKRKDKKKMEKFVKTVFKLQFAPFYWEKLFRAATTPAIKTLDRLTIAKN
jgi:hypothetical protein